MILSRFNQYGLCCFFVILIFLVLNVTPTHAENFQDAEKAYKMGNYAEALRISQALAHQGLADAQCLLGEMYLRGRGVPKSYEEAAKWCKKAADQGHPKAQFYLGNFHYHGWGVPIKDFVEAHKWLNLAAKSGYKDAARYRDIIGENLLALYALATAERLAIEWKPIQK